MVLYHFHGRRPTPLPDGHGRFAHLPPQSPSHLPLPEKQHIPNNILKVSEHSQAILMAVNQNSHPGGERPQGGATL
jgi:hypothetical protein